MEKEATIYDIAKKLKLSASTVSRALKGNNIINIDTRKKVQKCADEMGYRSNAFASNLRTQRTNTIGVVVPRLDSNFMSSCLAGMEEVANDKGYTLLISQSHESVIREAENTTTMFNKRVDGLIASLTIEDSDLNYFKKFNDKNVPIVFFDRVPKDSENVCFIIDNYKSAYEATQHLIENGCKQLLHISINSNSNVYVDRKKGFWDAVNENANLKGNVFVINALTLEGGKELSDQILKMNPMPDGLFFANDISAVGCIIALKEKGIEIPDDVAIVGFNNEPISTIVTPNLTSVSYPGREAGKLAAKSIIEQITGEAYSDVTSKVILNSELIIRESSKKIKLDDSNTNG